MFLSNTLVSPGAQFKISNLIQFSFIVHFRPSVTEILTHGQKAKLRDRTRVSNFLKISRQKKSLSKYSLINFNEKKKNSNFYC